MHIIFLSKFQRCFIIVPNKKKKISIALKSFVLLTKKIYKKKNITVYYSMRVFSLLIVLFTAFKQYFHDPLYA